MIFRSHTAVPDTPVCATVAALLHEWVSINRSGDVTQQVQLLGPSFVTCRTAGDVVDLIDRSPGHVSNQMLYSLVMAQSYLAHRILLQALLPKLLNNALRRARYEGQLDDHLQDCISELWEACASYPPQSTNHVVRNLTRTPYVSRRSVRETVAFVDQLEVPHPEQHDTNASDRLAELFDMALNEGQVSMEDLDLLRLVYLEEHTSREVAGMLGVSADSVRKRCQRIKQRLAAVAA